MSAEASGSEASGNSLASTEASNAAPDVKDILVGSPEGDAILAGAERDGFNGDAAIADGAADTPQQQTEALGLQDVLPGVDVSDSSLGAYLKIETVDGNTVISVEADGSETVTVPVMTLQDITGVTLQDLLNSSQIIT